MKIYTKTGDGGETSLLSGGRVAKDHPRIEAYGTLDELNSFLGLLLTEPLPEAAAGELARVQSALFAMGAALADAEGRFDHDPRKWAAVPLEGWIDGMDGELEQLRSFILPGGCRAAAIAHVARTVCRRGERCAIAAGREPGGIPDGVVVYLNRLSDCLFVLARWLNAKAAVAERRWPAGPGPRRGQE
ncbi:MAG TPA: cob(I)yrinic acid a,c-diamide adenosyltransferase [Thermoanaerobaculales bacterium]|nr:cob(I)yrinic acid a,c-diamide adenosyltransferase [Thermoanaerobaculales bacterium]HPA79593.1 cob(I)yrinic acid a,c-diamide adenosyltransferase [Thermoanaerobaculales bacterium]HQL29234.1 cob(I)yrinic acid a,c-diamide adenosyltransferase [Thermoanaerobaculales bacterium]HQN97390.1 cob(I)yrinic acid a,c-diamide adenosyltransferase [Thermoanaerobaculales bacterium]HQP42628.1 cob(I)yrinic acid a,c-diamide adenosyltransferase [Thermoanaerobaculales bacterium]